MIRTECPWCDASLNTDIEMYTYHRCEDYRAYVRYTVCSKCGKWVKLDHPARIRFHPLDDTYVWGEPVDDGEKTKGSQFKEARLEMTRHITELDARSTTEDERDDRTTSTRAK